MKNKLLYRIGNKINEFLDNFLIKHHKCDDFKVKTIISCDITEKEYITNIKTEYKCGVCGKVV